jgi:hypothetical protein
VALGTEERRDPILGGLPIVLGMFFDGGLFLALAPEGMVQKAGTTNRAADASC